MALDGLEQSIYLAISLHWRFHAFRHIVNRDFYLRLKVAPREKKEDEHIHGAGQIGLIAALALLAWIISLRITMPQAK